MLKFPPRLSDIKEIGKFETNLMKKQKPYWK